jgi:hypothetical protein
MLRPLVHINDILLDQITDENIKRFEGKVGVIHGSADNNWIQYDEKSNLLLSVENVDPHEVHEHLSKLQTAIIMVVLIRDPWNNMASRYHINKSITLLQDGVDMWSKFATFPRLLVYNVWIRDVNYRKMIAKTMFGVSDETYSDDSCREITGWARSYWDPCAINASDELLDKLETRYNAFMNDSIFYLLVFSNTGLRQLWVDITKTTEQWNFTKHIFD